MKKARSATKIISQMKKARSATKNISHMKKARTAGKVRTAEKGAKYNQEFNKHNK